jgi:hypothetical protein
VVHRLAIDRDLEVVGILQTAHDIEVRAIELRAELVFGVERERLLHAESADRAEGSPSMCWFCDRSWATRYVSLPARMFRSPTASLLICDAAVRYRSCNDGDTPSTSDTLSKPYAESSGGSTVVTSMSSRSRSRIAFLYSARLSR